MSKIYVVDGQQLEVAWTYRTHDDEVSSVVYTLTRGGAPLPGTVEKTRLGMFRAHGGQGQRIGIFPTLRAALEGILQAG